MSDDAIERVARRMTKAFSPGQPWTAEARVGSQPQDPSPYQSEKLGVCRRGRTLERRKQLSATEVAGEWEARVSVPCRGGRADAPREHVEWVATACAISPLIRMDTELLGALAYARLDGPLGPWLEVVALERFEKWPRVLTYALACGLQREAACDAASRIVWAWPDIPTQDQRAKLLGMPRAEFRRNHRRAEAMLREWLQRAAERVIAVLDEAASSAPEKGSSIEAPTNREDEAMNAVGFTDADRKQMAELAGLLRELLASKVVRPTLRLPTPTQPTTRPH